MPNALVTALIAIVATAIAPDGFHGNRRNVNELPPPHSPYTLAHETPWPVNDVENWHPYSFMDGICLLHPRRNEVFFSSWSRGFDKPPQRIDLDAIEADIKLNLPGYSNVHFEKMLNEKYLIWRIAQNRADIEYARMAIYDLEDMRIAKILESPEGMEFRFFNLDHVKSRNPNYYPLLFFGEQVPTYDNSGAQTLLGNSRNIAVAVLNFETLEMDLDYPVRIAENVHTPMGIRSMVLTADRSQVIIDSVNNRILGFKKGSAEPYVYPKSPENHSQNYFDCANNEPFLLAGTDRNDWIDKYNYLTGEGVRCTRNPNVRGIYEITISPDDHFALIRSDGHYLFDLKTMKLLQTIREPGDGRFAEIFSPCGSELAIARNGKFSLFKRNAAEPPSESY